MIEVIEQESIVDEASNSSVQYPIPRDVTDKKITKRGYAFIIIVR